MADSFIAAPASSRGRKADGPTLTEAYTDATRAWGSSLPGPCLQGTRQMLSLGPSVRPRTYKWEQHSRERSQVSAEKPPVCRSRVWHTGQWAVPSSFVKLSQCSAQLPHLWAQTLGHSHYPSFIPAPLCQD